MQAKSKNLLLGALLQWPSLQLFQLCMDMSVWINPSLLMNIPGKLLKSKRERNIFLVRAAVWKHEITITSEISHALKGILYFLL